MDLSTRYLGLELENPIVVAPSPITKKFEGILQLAEQGPGAIVLHSLFEEQIVHHQLKDGYDTYPIIKRLKEKYPYYPDFDEFPVKPKQYLEFIKNAKAQTNVPIIASVNGINNGDWLRFLKDIEEAGADAIELNIYFIPTDSDQLSFSIEEMYIDLINEVTEIVKIPIAVKLGPYLTNIANMCKRMHNAGAKGFVLFNQFFQPDLDIENMTHLPKVELTTSRSLLLPLRYTAILYYGLQFDISISSGVHTVEDIAKSILAGATTVQMASEILANGKERIHQLRYELMKWMFQHGYRDLREMRGKLSQNSCKDTFNFERAYYMRSLASYKMLTDEEREQQQSEAS